MYFEDYSIEKVIVLSEVSKKWNEKFRLADRRKDDFLNLSICKKVKDIIDGASVNEYVKNKKELEKNKKKFSDKVGKEVNALKNTRYSSIYVVVCLVEQSVFLELLKDITQLISNGIIRLFVYIGGGLISFAIMLKLLDMLVKKAIKQIEKDALRQINMSPLLCLSTWISGIDNSQIYKWGIIILVHILEIGIPLFVRKKK